MDKSIEDYLSEIGRKGGKKTSSNKKISSALNGKNAKRPHLIKVKYFLKQYPHKLKSTEFEVRFPIEIEGKKTTYNPDFFCKTTGYFIEVATSKPNISEQKMKWIKVIETGIKLKVFWWEGGEITKLFN